MEVIKLTRSNKNQNRPPSTLHGCKHASILLMNTVNLYSSVEYAVLWISFVEWYVCKEF